MKSNRKEWSFSLQSKATSVWRSEGSRLSLIVSGKEEWDFDVSTCCGLMVCSWSYWMSDWEMHVLGSRAEPMRETRTKSMITVVWITDERSRAIQHIFQDTWGEDDFFWAHHREKYDKIEKGTRHTESSHRVEYATNRCAGWMEAEARLRQFELSQQHSKCNPHLEASDVFVYITHHTAASCQQISIWLWVRKRKHSFDNRTIAVSLGNNTLHIRKSKPPEAKVVPQICKLHLHLFIITQN